MWLSLQQNLDPLLYLVISSKCPTNGAEKLKICTPILSVKWQPTSAIILQCEDLSEISSSACVFAPFGVLFLKHDHKL